MHRIHTVYIKIITTPIDSGDMVICKNFCFLFNSLCYCRHSLHHGKLIGYALLTELLLYSLFYLIIWGQRMIPVLRGRRKLSMKYKGEKRICITY